MRRKLVAAFVATLLGSLCYVVSIATPPANASVLSVITSNIDQIEGYLVQDFPSTWLTDAPTADGAVTALAEARQFVGVIPPATSTTMPVASTGAGVSLATTLVAGAGALYIGWKIPHTLGASQWIRSKIAGTGGAQTMPTAGTVRVRVNGWTWWGFGGPPCPPDLVTSGPNGVSAAQDNTTTCGGPNVLMPNVHYSTNSGSSYAETYAGAKVSCSGSNCPTISAPFGTGANTFYGALELAAHGAGSTMRHTITYHAGANEDYTYYFYYVTPTQLDAALQAGAIEQRNYDSARDHENTTAPNQAVPGLGDPTNQANEITAITSSDSLANWMANHLEPGTVTPTGSDMTMPDCRGLTAAACLAALQAAGFVGSIVSNTLGIDDAVLSLSGGAVAYTDPANGNIVSKSGTVVEELNPTPLPLELQALASQNQTGSQYVSDLTARGWTGTATYVQITAGQPAGDPDLGPSTPYLVKTPTTQFNPKLLPNPAPRITPTTDITVYENPTTTPTSAVPLPTGGSCACPAINFGPLTGIDYGSHFPFGIFTYVSGLFTATSTCPDFGLSKPGGGTQDVSLCSSAWETTYRGPVFGVLEFLMAVAAIWFVGWRIIGLGERA